MCFILFHSLHINRAYNAVASGQRSLPTSSTLCHIPHSKLPFTKPYSVKGTLCGLWPCWLLPPPTPYPSSSSSLSSGFFLHPIKTFLLTPLPLLLQSHLQTPFWPSPGTFPQTPAPPPTRALTHTRSFPSCSTLKDSTLLETLCLWLPHHPQTQQSCKGSHPCSCSFLQLFLSNTKSHLAPLSPEPTQNAQECHHILHP